MARTNMDSSTSADSTDESTRTSRRAFLTAAGATGTALSLAGCVGSIAGGGSESTKVGFVLPFSGTYSLLGESIVNGFKMGIEELDGEIDGSTVEYVRKDTEADPNKGVSITKEFLQSEQVDFLVGPVSSAVAVAMVQTVRQAGSAIWLNANAGDYRVTKDGCLDYHFRTSFNDWQTSAPLAPWVRKNVADNVYLAYADYAFGQNSKKFFAERFEKAGGTVVGEVGAPLGTSDYSPFLQKIKRSGADAVFSFFAGSDAVNYIKGFHEFGLDESMTQTGSGFLLSADTLPAQGDAAVGKYSILHYTPTKDTKANNEFVKNYKSAHDTSPNVYACQGYDSAQAAEKAVVDADGSSADDRVSALEAAELDSPRGFFKFDPATHDPIQDMDVREVVKKNGQVTQKVVTTLPKVDSPNWGCNLQ